MPSRSKYGARKTRAQGMEFDSQKEYRRFLQLQLLEKAGKIQNLKTQVDFELLPAQRAPDIIGPKGGKKPGKLLERAVVYRADFVYQEDGKTVVEDVKGVRTDAYIIKRKLMLYMHGIRILET